MHFVDPRELGGLDVISSNDVALGVVDGIYTDIRSGYPQWAAIQSGLLGITVRLAAPSLPVSEALAATGLNRNFTICSDRSGTPAPERHQPAGPAPAGAAGELPLDLLACSAPLSA